LPPAPYIRPCSSHLFVALPSGSSVLSKAS
jgi:hypothetical protein